MQRSTYQHSTNMKPTRKSAVFVLMSVRDVSACYPTLSDRRLSTCIVDTDFHYDSAAVEEEKKKVTGECRDLITRTYRVLRIVSNVRIGTVRPTLLDLETTGRDSREVSPWVIGAVDSKTRPAPAVTSPRGIAPSCTVVFQPVQPWDRSKCRPRVRSLNAVPANVT